MIIRATTAEDRVSIFAIFKEVIKPGNTYVYPANTSKEEMEKQWFGDGIYTFVAEDNRRIVGFYKIKANHIGRGSHVANGSYMVDPNHQGKGIGKELCQHSLNEARRLGFKAMQFNIVVSTNESAVGLWKKMGFEIIGTIPGAFNHHDKGFVDAYIMFQRL